MISEIALLEMLRSGISWFEKRQQHSRSQAQEQYRNALFAAEVATGADILH